MGPYASSHGINRVRSSPTRIPITCYPHLITRYHPLITPNHPLSSHSITRVHTSPNHIHITCMSYARYGVPYACYCMS